tara:strand:+ start:445 stop:1125 length:681 start_codon:yes stop_codon:yes gene_type:complete
MKYNIHQFPNPGFLTYQLTKDEMDFVWRRVAEVTDLEDNSKLYNDRLAGNISKSFDMGLHDLDTINNIIFRLANEYERQFCNATNKTYETQVSGKFTRSMTLNDWWVNYQYQTEFNPLHHHNGIYSWVIWMKIPTEFKDQSKLPIATNSNSNDKISNFNFTYTNVLGVVVDYKIEMSKAQEGTMAFFPARLKHNVYPFYNCDEPRISVAGNISMYSSLSEEPNKEK